MRDIGSFIGRMGLTRPLSSSGRWRRPRKLHPLRRPSTQKPGMAPRPPLLFSEPWRLPPYTGEQTDENMRFTPAVVTNPRIEVKLYGPDASVIRAAVHEERIDLWNGMASSPVGGDAAGPAQLRRPDRRRPSALDRADQRDSSAAPGREAGRRQAHRRRSRHHDAWRVPHRRGRVHRHALVRAGSGESRRAARR